MSNKHNLTLLVSSSKVLHPIAPIIDQDKALCPPYIHMQLYNMHLDEAGASRGNTEITDSFYYKLMCRLTGRVQAIILFMFMIL